MKKQMSDQELFNSVFLLQPSRPILCTTKNEDGSNHVAPFSWINPVSHKPPRIALALMNTPQKQHSLENIERTGEFVINVPDLDSVEKLVETSYSTKFGENKFIRSGFTKMDSSSVEPVSIQECRAHLECKVINSIVTGDHTLLIADILCAKYDEEAFGPGLLIKLDKYKPVIHMTNYFLKQSQVHVFLSPSGTYTTEVPYPKKPDIEDVKE